ncbi:MAG TPA: protein-disulfide reductase DsbD domain-containing protein [Chitinophagaceae bacterium]|jgi:thiol:disulfide interchange protein DsbD|nr:protein-disulfide reductase DsbD domain-containing protein [Chitinophagaceae bacterium]
MKKLFAFIAFVFTGWSLYAQNPISWSFSSKKISDKTFEVHLTANIQSGWHLYSQNQPDDAIAIPTAVKINNNPLLKLDGKIKEVGSMEKYKDKVLGISAHQYSNKVDFVQVVKMKSNAKTNVSGSVEFQTCDDKKCLPPKTVNFNIALK